VPDESSARLHYSDHASVFTLTSEGVRAVFLSRWSSLAFVCLTLALDFLLLMGLFMPLLGHTTGWSARSPNALSSAICASIFFLFIFNSAKLYRVEVIAILARYTKRFCNISIIFFWGLALLFFAFLPRFPIIGSGLWFAVWFAFGFLAFIAMRYALARAYHWCVDREIIRRDVIVVGATELAEKFISRVKKDALGVRVKAIFDDKVLLFPKRNLGGVPIIGDISDLLAYAKYNYVDTVIIALPFDAPDSLRQVTQRLSAYPLTIGLLIDPMPLELQQNWFAPTEELPGVNVALISVPPIGRVGLLTKDVFDRVVAGIALLFFAPLMFFCVLGIKFTSPGPILFKQTRIGYRNREFNVFKFRSMHVTQANSVELTIRNDPRVFAFGEIMRKLSLDELPQLLNVLTGEMSLVGPRPHMPEARAAGRLYYELIPNYAARHSVKPGITGWAQVNGWRGPTETVDQLENRITHDLYYIKNWSFGLDLMILVRTMFVGFFGENAF